MHLIRTILATPFALIGAAGLAISLAIEVGFAEAERRLALAAEVL
jgi:hypothetical protein